MNNLPQELWDLIRKFERKILFLEARRTVEQLLKRNETIVISTRHSNTFINYRKVGDYMIARYFTHQHGFQFIHFEQGLFRMEYLNRDISMLEFDVYDNIPNFFNYYPLVIENYTAALNQSYISYVHTYSKAKGWSIAYPIWE